ncbi:MAG: hypothetical protein JWM12_1645 [Ilumatobacteraceae bacterium]|nr:hypothetical protein [Ilumatobacteraceae bacterium]
MIIGGGAAAHACIAAYREHGGELSITLVSDDDRLPYFRPHLTKELLTGDISFDEIELEDDDSWYAAQGVDVHLMCRATGIDLPTRTVGTEHGPVPYAALLLATGSRAASLPVPGADDPAIVSVRHAADAARLLDLTADAQPVLVIGSGFVGCEAAASLRSRGLDVTMATTEAAPQVDRLGPATGRLIGGWLSDLGIGFRGGARAAGFERGTDSIRANFAEGPAIEAGTVIVATGATTNVEVAQAAGLAARDAVAVDGSMRTIVPGVFAAGDIADAMHPVAGRRLRVEHWGDAERMGTVAGTVMAGEQAAWTQVPGFWSNIGGRQLKYVAWGDGFDEVRVRPSAEGVTIWYGRDGLCAGILTFEHDEDLAAGDALIAAHAPFRR